MPLANQGQAVSIVGWGNKRFRPLVSSHPSTISPSATQFLPFRFSFRLFDFNTKKQQQLILRTLKVASTLDQNMKQIYAACKSWVCFGRLKVRITTNDVLKSEIFLSCLCSKDTFSKTQNDQIFKVRGSLMFLRPCYHTRTFLETLKSFKLKFQNSEFHQISLSLGVFFFLSLSLSRAVHERAQSVPPSTQLSFRRGSHLLGSLLQPRALPDGQWQMPIIVALG